MNRRRSPKTAGPRQVPPLVWDGTGVDPGQVCSVGTWSVQPAGAPLHRHLVLELLWNEAPMRLRLLDRCLLLRQPSVAILPPGTLHIAEPAGARYSRRKIGRDLSIRREVLEAEGESFGLQPAILPAQHTALVLPLLRHIHARVRATPAPSGHDLSYMLAGLCAVLRDLGYASQQPAGPAKGAVERALDVLYARHTDPALRVRDLAQAAALSESHFRRVFARRTGQSPHRVLTRLRRFHVIRLREKRHLKASAVAAGTGFGSVSAMYKQLRLQRSAGAGPRGTRRAAPLSDSRADSAGAASDAARI